MTDRDYLCITNWSSNCQSEPLMPKKPPIPPSETLDPAQQLRSEATRTKLLEAAIECFTKFGVAQTNTTSIAKYAGVSRGAYQHHFKNRETLISGAVALMVEKAQSEISTGIKGLFSKERPENVYHRIWKQAYPESFYAGYEMMLLSRHNETLHREWMIQSKRFALHRKAVLCELFDKNVAEEEAYPFLESVGDFFRGIKIMEIVRTEKETREVIASITPLFEDRLDQICLKLKQP